MKVLVTGATDGLGKAVATELARSGATVLVHGRDDTRGERTLHEIRSETGSDDLTWYRADLASLDEVRKLAERVGPLDVLVNNAGIGATGGRMVSADGYELRFAVNYLAAFLLTRLLDASRIVNVSSAGQAPIDFDDVMLERHYDGVQAYCQSKLALIMLTFDLAEQGVTANALHPGTYMPTKMVLDSGTTPVDSLETGVRATMRLIELEGVTGRYFNRERDARALAQAYDPDARRRLRELSERLTARSADRPRTPASRPAR
jgi:NAD(P)-dependent dehydrogenase (short-subunit alcohol dehydrogenase family)